MGQKDLRPYLERGFMSHNADSICPYLRCVIGLNPWDRHAIAEVGAFSKRSAVAAIAGTKSVRDIFPPRSMARLHCLGWPTSPCTPRCAAFQLVSPLPMKARLNVADSIEASYDATGATREMTTSFTLAFYLQHFVLILEPLL